MVADFESTATQSTCYHPSMIFHVSYSVIPGAQSLAKQSTVIQIISRMNCIVFLYVSLYVILGDEFLATHSTGMWVLPSMNFYSNLNPSASFSFPGLTPNTRPNQPSPSYFSVDSFGLCFVFYARDLLFKTASIFIALELFVRKFKDNSNIITFVDNVFSSLFRSCSFFSFLQIICISYMHIFRIFRLFFLLLWFQSFPCYFQQGQGLLWC